MKRPSVATIFCFILLYNFNATCFGLSTKRHHQATLQYQIQVTMLIEIALLFMSVCIVATLPSFCYEVLIDSFTVIANLKFLGFALPLDLLNLYSTCICVLVQICFSCVEYFLAQEVQRYRALIFSFTVLATHIASHKTTSPGY
jgi:hypothetical protein